MPSFSQLPSGKWRAHVRKRGLSRNATFDTRREAKDWASGIESQANHIAASGLAPIPKGGTVTKVSGKTKAATLAMFKRELGKVKLTNLSAFVLRDFIDRRQADGAGGVTIAADLSLFSADLKWGRHARQLDINERLALEVRASLSQRGLNTRSQERDREPADGELVRL